jgi:hypothetical protein
MTRPAAPFESITILGHLGLYRASCRVLYGDTPHVFATAEYDEAHDALAAGLRLSIQKTEALRLDAVPAAEL